MLVKPDNFFGRPYGFTTNQISHAMFIGFLIFVYGVTVVHWFIFDEFPHKESMFVFAGVMYFLYELYDQGWNGWDTIEDWVFVNCYGVWGPLLTFNEVRPGSTEFTGDIMTVLTFVVIFVVHLALGSLWRWYQGKRNAT